MKSLVREELCLNGLWDFKSAADNEWTSIRVPGCYAINSSSGKWARHYWDSFGYPKEWEGKAATYKRTFIVPQKMEGMNISFCCKGCFYHSRTYINGQFLGSFHDGYYPFEYDLTPFLTKGENEITIEVEETIPLTMGGESDDNRGIWKDTYLYAYSLAALTYGAYINTYVNERRIELTLPIKNYTSQTLTLSVKIDIIHNEEPPVHSFDGGKIVLDPHETGELTVKSGWDSPRLWFPHDPYLYHAHVKLYDEKDNLIDHFIQRFGFREISVEKHHLLLNGRELFLRGHGGHYCGDLQGSKEYADQWIKSLKEIGVNFMRMHVNPRHEYLYEAADELGFLIEAEGAYHFTVPEDETLWKDHLAHMVRDQRNHPSVIIWSVSNELRWRGGGEKPEMIEYTRSLDSTRPVFASDFSLCSTHGDVLGHHYNAETVYEEWEEFGPDKPMIWDELGNVWQPERPLRNGTAGYEVTCQDYATGLWRDGHDDMLKDIEHMSRGKVINGEFHRVNAIVPWDLSYCFFRFQPTNSHRTLFLEYESLEGEGIKQKRVPSCSSTINIWDNELPIFEPNPGFYFFSQYLLPVRFFHNIKISTLFGGEELTIKSRLEYDDLRLCDRIEYYLEDQWGSTFSHNNLEISLIPGQIVEEMEFPLILPQVSTPERMKLKSVFYYEEVPGWSPGRQDSLELTIFPGENLIQTEWKDNLKITRSLEQEDYDFVTAGGRILHLAAPGSKIDGSPQFLLHGEKHFIVEDLDQFDLTFMGSGIFQGGMGIPPKINVRNILSGDKNGMTSCLYEQILGKGCIIHCSLDLLKQGEPVACWLLQKCHGYLSKYRPGTLTKSTLYLGGEERKQVFLEAGVVLASHEEDETVGAIIWDGSRELNISQKERIKGLIKSGGTLFVDKICAENIPFIEDITGKKLQFTQPYLNETNHVIKAALSYTRRHTPTEWVQYYDSRVLPQPFEANVDFFLSGIANGDLLFEGKAFEQGIETEGMNPVYPHDETNMLLSNWRIDWSQPVYGGEYIQESKDIRRANWFINRNALLLEIKAGGGTILLSQLNLEALKDKFRLFLAKLFTHLGCSVGDRNYLNNPPYSCCRKEEQLNRFLTRGIPVLTRRDDELCDEMTMGQEDNGQNRILFMGDDFLKSCKDEVNKKLEGWGKGEYASLPVAAGNDIGSIHKNLYGLCKNRRWHTVYLSISLSDCSLKGENLSVEDYVKQILSLVKKLDEEGSKVFWGTALPVSREMKINTELYHQYDRALRKSLLSANCYLHDLGQYARTQEISLKTDDLQEIEKEQLSEQISQALRYFGE